MTDGEKIGQIVVDCANGKECQSCPLNGRHALCVDVMTIRYAFERLNGFFRQIWKEDGNGNH